jgi:hypothetical protein
MPLRQFLYYDESLVEDFLAQLEGGQAGDVRKREQLQHDGKDEISTGAMPLAAGVQARNVTQETEAVIRQGRASKFQRLYELLITAGELTEIEDSLDAARWNSVKRGSLLELDIQVMVPQMTRLFADPAAFGNLASLIKAINPESIDAEAEKVLDVMSTLSKSGAGDGGTLTAVGNPPQSPYRLVMRLERKFIVPGAELDGEATVLVKMARKLKEDDKELVVDLPGLSTLGAELRNAMSEATDSEEFTVRGPGAIVVPIAIFR